MSVQQKSRKFSRREMLKLTATASVGMFVTACEPSVLAQSTSPKSVEGDGEMAGGKKVVRLMLASWAASEVPFAEMAQEFGEVHDEVEIEIDTSRDRDKVLAQISSGNVDWSGFGIITTFTSLVSDIESGLIQPMEDLIQSSPEAGSDILMGDMIETVKADGSYEGHFYALPYSFENVTFNWRNDQFAEIGVTERPETWSDWYETAVEMKKWGASQEIIPTSFAGKLWTDTGALITSAMTKPYTNEGLINWEAPEAIEALQFYRKLVSEGLTPVYGFEDWLELYQQGKVASVQAQSSRGVWGQRMHGEANVTTSPIPTLEKGGGSGTVYWGNGLGVVNGAPFPQEMVDFYIYTLGPNNKSFQKAVIKSGKTPIYNSTFDEIIATDPLFDTFKWMNDMRDNVAQSTPVPRNAFYRLQHKIYEERIVEFIEDSSISPETLAQLLVEDTLEEIDQ